VNNGTTNPDIGYASGQVNLSFDLDGRDDYVEGPASSALDLGHDSGMTVELWTQPDSKSTPGRASISAYWNPVA
jgi:hypothetical protein